MAAQKVIVFGPTGQTGSSAALTAAKLGAKVFLAMRDVEKALAGLDKEKEKELGFERVHADLTKADTVKDAVTKTGAQRAFIYLAHATKDHMRSVIEAMKSAGIELVVFLSSLSVINGDLAQRKAIPSTEFIAFAHAQVEVALEEVFGPQGYVALRGGAFASNARWYKKDFQAGEVKLFMPEARIDNIVPADIGRVAGTILAKGPQDDKNAIYIYGPELMTFKDAMQMVAKAIGKEPKWTIIDGAEQQKLFELSGMPPPVAEYMVRVRQRAVPGAMQVFGVDIAEEDLKNVQKYSGLPPTTFAEYLEQNKHEFEA